MAQCGGHWEKEGSVCPSTGFHQDLICDLTFLLRLFALGLRQQLGDLPQGTERQAECGSWGGLDVRALLS